MNDDVKTILTRWDRIRREGEVSLSVQQPAQSKAADPVVVALPVRWIITRACVREEM